MAYGDYMGRDEFLEEMREATKPRVVVSDITSDQKEMMLLHIIAGMGGETDSSESKWSWLNWFCGDEREGDDEDTFNRCHTKRWLHSTHNSDTDQSVTTLTDAGREAMASTITSGGEP
ncbi:hypothetical protein [Shinella sp.]|jgi:hypothetical protein|uniref:hypothetical protein n=1 Tax=Shinella sp. TaxID=1870904 RepID=UPI003F719BB8